MTLKPGRRDFLQALAAGSVSLLAAPQTPKARRRVTVGGRPIRVIDVPFNWPVTVDLVLGAPFLSDADKTAILGGNLARRLRL